MSLVDPRKILTELFEVAVEAARGDELLRACCRVQSDRWIYDGPGGFLEVPLPPPPGRVIITGAGKAAASLARGMEQTLADRIDGGLIIVKHGHIEPLRIVQALEADHPVPGEASLAATQALARLLDATTPPDVVFFLLTGGASSLLCMPVEGLSLADKSRAGRVLVNSGATIEEINTVRKHLSAVKGGKLRLRAAARTFCTLAISDVIGDDPSTIGSGPTVADPTSARDALEIIRRHGLIDQLPTTVMQCLQRAAQGEGSASKSGKDRAPLAEEFRVVASIRTSLAACAKHAKQRGFEVCLVNDRMLGQTHEVARAFAENLRRLASQRSAGAPPLIVLCGGETTLAVTGRGRGGRNQEFAAVTAMHLQGMSNVSVLAAGTDGTDGPTDAAGGFADGSSIARAQAAGLNVSDHLRENDIYPLLARLGDLFKSGPTGTNVADLVVAIVGVNMKPQGRLR